MRRELAQDQACCVPQCNTKSNEVVMEFAQDESADATATCSLVEMRLCAHAPLATVCACCTLYHSYAAHPRASASRLLLASHAPARPAPLAADAAMRATDTVARGLMCSALCGAIIMQAVPYACGGRVGGRKPLPYGRGDAEKDPGQPSCELNYQAVSTKTVLSLRRSIHRNESIRMK